MYDIHQSPLYAQFMQSINWDVEKIDDVYIYIKQIPLLGSIIKIQRSNKLPQEKSLINLMKKYHAKSITIEPADQFLNSKFLTLNSKLCNDPFLPTKTIHIDLTASEKDIFNRFSSAKRRAIRKAQKLGVKVIQSGNINDFIRLKNKTSGFLGFLNTTTLKPLWKTFVPNYVIMLLAYLHYPSGSSLSESPSKWPNGLLEGEKLNNLHPVAGIPLLFWHKVAYYWIAASTKQGDQNYAPSLLAWEALKLAKKKKCDFFDFEGVYDERFPKINRSWLGFTRFKQGFGGKEIYFHNPYIIKF